MLRQFDIPLSTPIEKLPQVSDRTYIFANAVVVCLEPEITTELIEKLAALYGVSVEQLENEQVEPSKLSYAFRGGELSTEEMEAISAINRIALNAEFMRVILERE